DDEVGHAHSAEAVRNQDGDAAAGRGPMAIARSAAGGRRIALEEGMLGFGVEGSGGLIQHQQQRAVAHETAGECDFLPLSETDVHTGGPGGPELGFEAPSQLRDDVVRAGAVHGNRDRRQVLEAWYVAQPDTVTSAQLEAVKVLERTGQARAP